MVNIDFSFREFCHCECFRDRGAVLSFCPFSVDQKAGGGVQISDCHALNCHCASRWNSAEFGHLKLGSPESARWGSMCFSVVSFLLSDFVFRGTLQCLPDKLPPSLAVTMAIFPSFTHSRASRQDELHAGLLNKCTVRRGISDHPASLELSYNTDKRNASATYIPAREKHTTLTAETMFIFSLCLRNSSYSLLSIESW